MHRGFTRGISRSACAKAVSPNDTIQIEPFTQDVLSIIYFIRSQELKAGETIPVEHINNMKLYPLDIKVREKVSVRVDMGEFDCYLVEPAFRPGFDKEPKGQMTLWISDDENKIPIKINTSLPFGSLDMELDEIKTTG